MSARAEMKKLVDKASKQGFKVSRSGGKHWKVEAPDGRKTYLSFSPSAVGPQTMKQLREIGYKP